METFLRFGKLPIHPIQSNSLAKKQKEFFVSWKTRYKISQTHLLFLNSHSFFSSLENTCIYLMKNIRNEHILQMKRKHSKMNQKKIKWIWIDITYLPLHSLAAHFSFRNRFECPWIRRWMKPAKIHFRDTRINCQCGFFLEQNICIDHFHFIWFYVQKNPSKQKTKKIFAKLNNSYDKYITFDYIEKR